MPVIGHVTRNQNGGFTGELRTLSIRVPIELVPGTRRAGEANPDYQLLSDGLEFGAGWNRRSEATGRDYVSLSLAAPEFGPRRIYASLAPLPGGGDKFALIWVPAD